MADSSTYEEGEILEDGEIADDDDDCHLDYQSQSTVSTTTATSTTPTTTSSSNQNKSPTKSLIGTRNTDSFEKENHDNLNENYSEHSYCSTSTERGERDSQPKGRRHPRKRKRSQSREGSFKKRNGNKHFNDITEYLEKPDYDSSRFPEFKQLNFENLDFDMFFDIFKITVNPEFLRTIKESEHKDMMLRILKICKQIAHSATEFKRKFARLKKLASQQNRATKNKYKTPCKFFLEGKCQKGIHCTFSHDCEVPKKEDICKFYLQGHCGKGDNCNYMHGAFPCKFFHTGVECYKNDKCRFSHAPLDEKSKQILDNYLRSNSRDEWKTPAGGAPGGCDGSGSDNSSRQYGDNVYEDETHFNRHNDPDYDGSEESFPPLHNRSRPALLGPVPERLKRSYRTWRWQQDCFELKDDYKGSKYNLFTINNDFVVTTKPPPSDDEEDQEAMINYYCNTLSEDDREELIYVREIEEHRRTQDKLAEEEKAMANAAAFDVDLRHRTRDQPYIIPPVFGIDMSFLKKLQENAPLPELPQYAPQPPPIPLPVYNPLPLNGPPFQSQPMNVLSPQQEPIFNDPRFMKELCPNGPDRRIHPNAPRVLPNDSRNLSSDPRALSSDHRTLGPDPRAIFSDPRASISDPRTLTSDPRALTSDPRSLSTDPRAISSEPRPLVPDPRSLNTDSRSLNSDNRPVVLDPRTRSIHPEILGYDPRVQDLRSDPRCLPDLRKNDPRQANVSSTSSSPSVSIPPHLVNDPRLNKTDQRIPETRIDDPRVNRSLRTSPPYVMKSQTSLDEFSKKPFVKAFPPTLADYRLKASIKSRIDYRSYEELFNDESSSKDPRLQKFFKPISSPEASDNPETKKEPKASISKLTENILDSHKKSSENSVKTENEIIVDSNEFSIKSENSDKSENQIITTAPSTTETTPNFSQILAQSFSSTTTSSETPKPADIPFYARGLLTQTSAPLFSTTSGLLSNLMSVSSNAPTISRQLSSLEEKRKEASSSADNDPDSDAEPDLVIASEYD